MILACRDHSRGMNAVRQIQHQHVNNVDDMEYKLYNSILYYVCITIQCMIYNKYYVYYNTMYNLLCVL